MADANSKSLRAKAQFVTAAAGKIDRKKYPLKYVIPAVLIILVGLYYVFGGGSKPKARQDLFNICAVYIERHLQFPETMKIIQYEQRIPEGEDVRKPNRIDLDLTFSDIDGFGQSILSTVTCGYKLEPKLKGTPWQGLLLERVLFEGRMDHGWADVYYPPDKKTPRASDDRSEEMELFNATLPAILKYPPNYVLPRRDLDSMKVEDLQNL